MKKVSVPKTLIDALNNRMVELYLVEKEVDDYIKHIKENVRTLNSSEEVLLRRDHKEVLLHKLNGGKL